MTSENKYKLKYLLWFPILMLLILNTGCSSPQSNYYSIWEKRDHLEKDVFHFLELIRKMPYPCFENGSAAAPNCIQSIEFAGKSEFILNESEVVSINDPEAIPKIFGDSIIHINPIEFQSVVVSLYCSGIREYFRDGAENSFWFRLDRPQNSNSIFYLIYSDTLPRFEIYKVNFVFKWENIYVAKLDISYQKRPFYKLIEYFR